MKISNADGVEFEQAVTVPTATLDGHAINKGQADDAYAPIGGGGVTDHGALTGLADDDHTQYAILTPATSARNTIQPVAADKIPLILKAFASQTVDLMQWQSSAGAALAAVNAAGKVRAGLVGAGALTHQFEVQGGHLNFVSIPDVAASGLGLALSGTPGNVDNGDHYYKIAYATAYGVTGIYPYGWSSKLTVVDNTASGQVNISNIPVSTDPAVTERRLYRSKASDPSGMYYLLATLNLTDTTYVDNTADAALGANATYQQNSTTGKMFLDGTKIFQSAGGFLSAGSGALASVTSGTGLVGLGTNALGSATTATNSVGIGASALSNETTGSSNIAIGSSALANLNGGLGDVAVGVNAGKALTGGIYNTLIGDSAGRSLSGHFNVAVGVTAGGSNTGSSNVFLGAYAGFHETSEGRLYIDSGTRASEADGRIKALLYGEFNATMTAQLLRVNGGLQSLMTDAGTSAATTPQLKISRNVTTGTPTNGYSSLTQWTLNSSTTADQVAAAIEVAWNDATHATRKADLILSAFDTAIREGLRIRANGSAPAIGFLGAAPVAQAAHIADAKTDYAAGDLDSEAEIISAINTLNGKINAILAVLENVGLVATA